MDLPSSDAPVTALCIVMVANLLWDIFKKRNSTIDADLKELIKNTMRLQFEMHQVLLRTEQIDKMKVDLRRIFTMMRFMAGDKWEKLREIMDDKLES
jgi:hypothetical protein